VPQVIVTEQAAQGLEKCRKFLAKNNPQATNHASQIIQKHLALLVKEPMIGRPLQGEPELRELIIPFGDSGYVTLYNFDPNTDSLVLLAFRHQREAGY